ncbi:formimidoylglutamate deiminase [Vibrio tritonius]|uniref:formimidoylglutamate deiminase n=1 Tax=Vibrio tritonius TaxID=1435069 RepID=UPI00315D0E91
MTAHQSRTTVFADLAWIDDHWQQQVTLEIEQGTFVSVQTNSLKPTDALHVKGPLLPTLANVHSHAFQRVMAGMAEISLHPDDSFWSWRDLMYKIVGKLSPEQANVIATQLYIEMLKAGYTQVGEFHYLHHATNGAAYSNPAEMSLQLLDAAQRTGMGLTLLPVLYSYSGFGSQPANSGQARFIHSADSYLALHQQLEAHFKDDAKNRLGICFHSLRAVSEQQIQEVLGHIKAPRPIHIHVAEQQKEVNDCLSWSGERPVEWLNNHIGLDSRWTLIHATHLNPQEIAAIASSGAIAGLCPTTEANLGDGIFPGVEYEKHHGHWAIGSDSHVSLSIVDELRTLEYGQRLRDQQRNRLYRTKQNSFASTATPNLTNNVGEYLFNQALQGGNQSCAVKLGIAVGNHADFMVLDKSHPFIDASQPQDLFNRWIFACNDNMVKDVYVAGKAVIKNGQHALDAESRTAFTQVIKKVIYDA